MTGWIGEAPRIADVDVCIIGAGSAGSTAAIAAARAGASVLLLDRLPFLGGTSTAVLDTFYGFYTPGASARKVVGGIGDDVVSALPEFGPVIERPNTYGAGTGVTYLAEHLKVNEDPGANPSETGASPLAVAARRDPRDIDMAALLNRLRVDGAILELSDSPDGDARDRPLAVVDVTEAPATR